MQNRKPLRFWYILSALACWAIVLIGARNQLGYYIHPRYHIFTLIFTAIAGLILVKAAFDYRFTGQTEVEYETFGELVGKFAKWLLQNGAWFVIIVVILLIWSPSRPLMSRAAERKQKESAPYARYVYDAPWYSNPTSIYQINTIVNTPKGPADLQGREFDLTGFVRAGRDGDPDVFELSRFVISCCAVDATPSKVRVIYPGWSKNLKIDQWVNVKGVFDTVNRSGKEIDAITDAKVTKVDQPSQPYEYMAY